MRWIRYVFCQKKRRRCTATRLSTRTKIKTKRVTPHTFRRAPKANGWEMSCRYTNLSGSTDTVWNGNHVMQRCTQLNRFLLYARNNSEKWRPKKIQSQMCFGIQMSLDNVMKVSGSTRIYMMYYYVCVGSHLLERPICRCLQLYIILRVYAFRWMKSKEPKQAKTRMMNFIIWCAKQTRFCFLPFCLSDSGDIDCNAVNSLRQYAN